MSWASRAAASILPLSREQNDLAIALKEWRYTGNFHDLEIAEETCELCSHPDIRYQFEIGNLHTEHTLLVGSECINRFGITATDDKGSTLSVAESKKKVGRDRRKLVEDARKRRVVNNLVALVSADEKFANFDSFLDYLQKRGAFTPKQMALLLWRMNANGIKYRPSDFKIILRRDREKDQILAMDDWQRDLLWPCLSSSQKKWLEKALDDS